MKKMFHSCILIMGSQLMFYASSGQGPSAQDMLSTDQRIEFNSGSVNQKAIEHFHKQFGNNIKERWEITKSGSRVNFLDDGVRSSVMYNRRGHWLNTVVSRNEHHVTAQTAELINSFYPGYHIVLEISVDSYKGSATLVKIENETVCKTLRLVDGQMELLSEFERA